MTTIPSRYLCAPPVHIQNPVAKTKREVHLETLLKIALPYIEREELSTRTSPFTRHVITEIQEQIKGK